MRYTPTHSDEKREPLCPGGCLWVSVGVTGYGRSSPWRGRQGGRMLLRPYPDGRKIGTLKRCGFKKQSCLFDRQGRGVLHTPSNRARQGPGACLVFGGGLTPTSPHLLFLFVYMNRQGRGVSNTSYRGQGIAFCRSMDVPGCRGVSNTPSRRHRRWRIHVLRSSPWRGRWGGRMQYAHTHSDEKREP